MEGKSNHSFFIGVLLLLIYERCFYLFFALNEIVFLHFKGTETSYVTGAVLALIIINVVVFGLYKSFVRYNVFKTYVFKLVLAILMIIGMNALSNYCLGYLGASGIEAEGRKLYFKYYGYKSVAFLVNTTILLIFFGYYIKNKKS